MIIFQIQAGIVPELWCWIRFLAEYYVVTVTLTSDLLDFLETNSHNFIILCYLPVRRYKKLNITVTVYCHLHGMQEGYLNAWKWLVEAHTLQFYVTWKHLRDLRFSHQRFTVTHWWVSGLIMITSLHNNNCMMLSCHSRWDPSWVSDSWSWL